MTNQSIIFLNGAPGSGKSTLAQAFAETLPKSVMLDADFIRTQIVGGRVRLQREDPKEFVRQRLLAAKAVIAQTRLFYRAGYSVIIVSMTHTSPVLKLYFPGLEKIGITKKVLLTPSKEVLYIRDKERPEFKHTPEKALNEFYEHFNSPAYSDWVRLDTSNQTVEESVKSLIALTD